MADTFKFEELDAASRDYLIAVRDAEGRGAPGVFAESTDSLRGVGCFAGPIIIAATLAVTLGTWAGVIYDDPRGVALLQTAGLLLGGWLLLVWFRSGKGSDKFAGTWVYLDSLFLYEAFREQITVTPIEDAIEANFTHNYNNGTYQNSVVRIDFGDRRVSKVTLKNERRAERMVVFLNYLAYARGPDGGERASLAPATLGGLAKYVAKNENEPLDAENNINLNLIELDITEVPEAPTREGRAVPAVVPYLVMLAFAVVCFFVMGYVVNPPLRDDAIYNAVMKEPSVEPRFLRAYLVDSRNQRHRDEVTKRLSRFYDPAITYVKQRGGDAALREGMAKVLDALRTADQPVVSMRVKEANTPAGLEGTKTAREDNLRTLIANGVNDEFARQWGPVPPPPGVVFKEQPPPLGHQLIAFIEPPDGADKVHFDITYSVEPAGAGQHQLSVTVEIRANIDEAPVAKKTLEVPGTFDTAALPAQMTKVRDVLIKAMIGSGNNNPVPNMPAPPDIPF